MWPFKSNVKKIKENSDENVSALDVKRNYETVSRDGIFGLDKLIGMKIDPAIYLINHFKEMPRIPFPKGCLIKGAPGTGKTYLSRYMISNINTEVIRPIEDNYRRIQIKETYDFCRNFVNRHKKPIVVFADEADKMQGYDISELLQEVDGIYSRRNRGVFWLLTAAVTAVNEGAKISKFDDQLFRPGRFEKVETSLPNLENRAKMLRYYMEIFAKTANVPCNGDVNYNEIAALIPDASPALIVDLASQTIQSKSIEKLKYAEKYGPVKNDNVVMALKNITLKNYADERASTEERKTKAVHEIGHKLVASKLGYDVPFVTIEPSFDADGLTYIVKEKTIVSEKDLENYIKIGMAGYVMEEIMKYPKNTGCFSDLNVIKKAYDGLGKLVKRVDENAKIKTLIEYEKECKNILSNYGEDVINKMVDKLLEKGTVVNGDLTKI
jgi:ATP-dependent 26S proteasome regulatory subunit